MTDILRATIAYHQSHEFLVHLQFFTGEQPEMKCFLTVLIEVTL